MRLLAAPLLLSALAACANPYAPAGWNGGYSDVQLEHNVFRVTFQGNAAMRQSDTDELAMMRSAEVATRAGFGYFTSSGAAATGTAMALPGTMLRVPASTVTIVCYVERPGTSAIVHDARQMVALLKTQAERR